MAGLLDAITQFASSDEGMGLAQGLLSARGSQGMAAGVAGMQEARRYAEQKKMHDIQMQAAQLQLENARRDAAKQEQMQQMYAKFATPPVQGMGSTEGVNAALPSQFQIGAQPQIGAGNKPAGYDFQGLAGALAQVNPMASLDLQAKLKKEQPEFNPEPRTGINPATNKPGMFIVAKNGQMQWLGAQPRDEMKLAPSGEAYNPFAIQPGTVLADSNKPFAGFGANGQPIPNTQYQQYEINKSRAGAPSTSVKIENKMGESVAAQVGPMLKDSYTQANGAVQTIDAANRIISAVDTGKLITGPLANARLNVAQLGQTLGVGGKDDAEKIANTRQAIRGLAEMTLQGRKQMTGQGAVTDSESALAERAMSGNIDLTASEIKQLAGASARSARFIYGQHESMLGNLSADPNTAGIAKFYKPMPMPKMMGVAAPEASNVVNWGDLK